MISGVLSSLGGSSLSVQGAQGTFDVTKESDVIALLKLIHQNPIDPEIKNQLRDLIFSYRQDLAPAAFSALVAICTDLGITLVASSNPNPVAVTPLAIAKISQGRPLPSFSGSTIAQAPKSVQKENESVSVPLRKIVVPKFDVVASSVPATPAPATPEIVPPPAKQQETIVPTETLPRTPVDITSVQARISEIKRTVNEKVGNPVNLIDAHNEIGRAYMNALLDAMKKSNGAGVGELALAMTTLETAYAAVMDAVLGSPQKPQDPKPIPKDPVVSEAVPTSEKPSQAPSQQSASVPPVMAVPVAPEPSAEEKVKILEVKLEALKKKIEVEKPFRRSPIPEPPLTEVVAPIPEPVVENKPSPATIPTIEVAQKSTGLHSVAKNKQLQDLLRSNREKEVVAQESKEHDAIAKMDPLLTPEVTAGLSQLLSEWRLFRSSGFFGTGPSGKDHVLYQKLGGLTMASVIAGRFEGATPLIKQSIADYMNGWRYEEGIVHEHGETFEHYLRKVVYHIVEKKKLALTRR